jgi:hypothetical protein
MATVTFFFADQAGSTVQPERLGDAAAKGVRQALIDMLRQAAEDHHCQVVDHTGDGLMITFASAVDAVACGVVVAAVDWAPEETEFPLPEPLAAAAAGPFVGRAAELAWLEGLSLISAGGNGLVVWDLRPSTLVDKACTVAGRNLTRDEWRQFVGGEYRRTCPQWPEGVA